ncbi:hypothetical protein ABTZ03_19850 [Kitasatospora sp. NPDC096077]|uniref:hypothetical protein n=1 Tax=Kitasatospora sp. NPDC096077 TaxID=3155544 RepID=UPI00331ADADC
MTQLEQNCPTALPLLGGPVTDTAAVLAAARGLHAWDPRRPAVGQLPEHLLDHGDDARARSPHQGRNQLAPFDDSNVIPVPTARIERRQAVTGLINECHRAS